MKKKVLIVEDESPKQKNLTKFFSENYCDFELLFAMSVGSALDEIEDSDLDLVILDMSLPTTDVGDKESGGRPQGFGGLEVLTNITILGKIIPVIVLTGYESFLKEEGDVSLDKLRDEWMALYPSVLRGVLHYSSTYGNWIDELRNLISDMLKSKK